MSHDRRMTFESFVVGPANRLAFAAARRTAESPGSSYNPLFLYSASGLGKSHILSAIAQHCLRSEDDLRVVYQTMEGYLEDLREGLERGEEEGVRRRYAEADVLLLDDVQFLTGQSQAQEMLLRSLDQVAARRGQVVLASDRPPAEIDGLDERLLSRFSGGLIVDIGQPDYETRVAIIQRKAGERGAALAVEVPQRMARFPFRNVRELQGALNRVLAVQEVEGRQVAGEELAEVLGGGDAERVADYLRALDVGGEVGRDEGFAGEEEPEWRRAFREAAEAVELSGFSAGRLRRILEGGDDGGGPEGWKELLDAFHRDVEKVRALRRELDDLGNPWPDAAAAVLRDPDRLRDGDALLASARERVRPFPHLPSGPGLGGVSEEYPALAVRAAERVMGGDRPEYNPLYLHAPDSRRAVALLGAIGRTFQARRPSARIGFISVDRFSEEFIRAISSGVAGAWRERWWTVDLLLLHGLERLSSTERSQEEVFHLFEALKRRGARIIVAADRPPSAIPGVDDRLRSRFEGGLVVELGGGTKAGEKADPGAPRPDGAEPDGDGPPEEPPGHPGRFPTGAAGDSEAVLTALRAFAGVKGGGERAGPTAAVVAEVLEGVPPPPREEEDEDQWFPSREKVVWVWPRTEERIVDEEG
jgi:chromosomal replication initiator protein